MHCHKDLSPLLERERHEDARKIEKSRKLDFENPLLPEYKKLDVDARNIWQAHLLCNFLNRLGLSDENPLQRLKEDCERRRHGRVSLEFLEKYSPSQFYHPESPFLQTLVKPFEEKYARYQAQRHQMVPEGTKQSRGSKRKWK